MLEKLDRVWTRVEVALAISVAGALVLSLWSWVVLSAMASSDSLRASLGRALLLAPPLVAIGLRRRWHPALGAGVAVLVGAALRDLGRPTAANLLGWLQDGSLLTWLGGMRGLSTRLTLLLCLLGASLATATGRHLSMDALVRTFSPARKHAVERGGAVVAALVCFACAWGFFDFVAIDAFSAKSGSSFSQVLQSANDQFFYARRQLRLDVGTLPAVLSGTRWDRSWSARDWNAFVDSADWSSHVSPDVVARLHESNSEELRTPLLSVPGVPARGALVRSLNLMVPFGLLMIALRFLLRAARGVPEEPAS